MGCACSSSASASATEPDLALVGATDAASARQLHLVEGGGRFAPLESRVPRSEAEMRRDPARILRVEVASMHWRLNDSAASPPPMSPPVFLSGGAGGGGPDAGGVFSLGDSFEVSAREGFHSFSASPK